MGNGIKPNLLNLGCGLEKLPGHVNVDGYASCRPDVLWDLDITPYPWADSCVDGIEAWHVLEHLDDWWPCVAECARILKPGGYLHVRVPHDSSSTALTYRDHHHVFSLHSWHGIRGYPPGTNAWAMECEATVPLKMTGYQMVPHKEFNWMVRFPRVLGFLARHARNFIHEQRFDLIKVGPDDE